jgi:YidC/Oxa1 family membrane protein insertase
MYDTKGNVDQVKKLFFVSMVSIFCVYLYSIFFIDEPKKKAPSSVKNQKEIEIEDRSRITLTSTKDAISELNKNHLVRFENDKIEGFINPKGLKIESLVLKNYRKENSIESVNFLNPANSFDMNYINIGWTSDDSSIRLPDKDTTWSFDKNIIKDGKHSILSWSNGAGLKFIVDVSLDKNYMFHFETKVINNTSKNVNIKAYGRVKKIFNNKSGGSYHEGALFNLGQKVEEVSYSDIEKASKSYDEMIEGWIGLSDKYWLSAFIFDDHIEKKTTFRVSKKPEFINSKNIMHQLDFVTHDVSIKPNSSFDHGFYLFSGAKEIELIEQYQKNMKIHLFDRSVDFGYLYFLTKPILKFLKYINAFTSNFGWSIIILTIIIRVILFPLANKSYKSMSGMRKLAPELSALKDKYKDDKKSMNMAIVTLYKAHNINPASGCLPLLLQIPVFFALYKVLIISIDLRDAPFIWWIKDLSERDHTSMFNAFGLIPFDVPSFMQIGVLPLLMCLTMVLQQKFSPQPTDPSQAMVMKTMPYVMTIMFSSFPSGLMVYWIISNTFSIVQQYILSKKSL